MRAPVESVVVRARDDSAVGEARRAARRLAKALGLADVAVEQAAIVATEACRNLVTHGRGGELVLGAGPGGSSVDVLALDRGPGIPDVARAMEDGYSTAGTPGQGLGALARLASILDIYSLPGMGTALFARAGKGGGGPVEVGAVCAGLASEEECGDLWALETPGGREVVLVADGLGHGARAAEAARAAVAAFRRHAASPVDRLLQQLHLALRPTRGAALAVAQLAGEGNALRYGGIGNISGTVVSSGKTRKMVSLPGTAGHQARAIRTFDYEWPEDGLLIMHSDGIATHWDLGSYPGLALRHPAVVAGILYRDFARARDDATVVVVRRCP
jgi:anti-sigma regulatory factor (Ser/Thr protein kinase)